MKLGALHTLPKTVSRYGSKYNLCWFTLLSTGEFHCYFSGLEHETPVMLFTIPLEGLQEDEKKFQNKLHVSFEDCHINSRSSLHIKIMIISAALLIEQ